MDRTLLQRSSPLTIEESARAVGAWAWAERSLYEVVGSWVAPSTNPAAKIYFDACSQHHAWRAQMFVERLPGRLAQAYPRPASPANTASPNNTAGSGGPGEPADLVSPFSRGAQAAMEALTGLSADAGRLAAYTRVVLARSTVAFGSWLDRCSPSSDRPMSRVLGLLLADVVADWQEGSRVLMSLLGGEDALSIAAAASTTVERLLLDGGLAPGA